MSVVVSHDLEDAPTEKDMFIDQDHSSGMQHSRKNIRLSVLRDKVRFRFYSYVPWNSVVFWCLLLLSTLYVYISLYRLDAFRQTMLQTEESLIHTQYKLLRLMCNHHDDHHDVNVSLPPECKNM